MTFASLSASFANRQGLPSRLSSPSPSGLAPIPSPFTLVHAILMKSLPVTDASTRYRVGDKDDCCVNGGFMNDDGDFDLFSYDLYQHLGAAAPVAGFYFLTRSRLAAFQGHDWLVKSSHSRLRCATMLVVCMLSLPTYIFSVGTSPNCRNRRCLRCKSVHASRRASSPTQPFSSYHFKNS